MLEAVNCRYAIAGKNLVSGVSVSVKPGRVVGLMGPNGAGKSTLIKLMSGQLKPTGGEVQLDGRPLARYSTAELAVRRSLLAQSRQMTFPFSACEVVLLGRNPLGASRRERRDDEAMARELLARTDAAHLAARAYHTLSGGEAARVDMARILAQNADVLFLDEPTNHLDPQHQMAVLKLCRALAAEGKAVAVSLHDLTLAANFCDDVLLLKNGAVKAWGTPETALTLQNLREVYDMPFHIIRQPGAPVCIVPAVDEPEMIAAPVAVAG